LQYLNWICIFSGAPPIGETGISSAKTLRLSVVIFAVSRKIISIFEILFHSINVLGDRALVTYSPLPVLLYLLTTALTMVQLCRNDPEKDDNFSRLIELCIQTKDDGHLKWIINTIIYRGVLATLTFFFIIAIVSYAAIGPLVYNEFSVVEHCIYIISCGFSGLTGWMVMTRGLLYSKICIIGMDKLNLNLISGSYCIEDVHSALFAVISEVNRACKSELRVATNLSIMIGLNVAVEMVYTMMVGSLARQFGYLQVIMTYSLNLGFLLVAFLWWRNIILSFVVIQEAATDVVSTMKRTEVIQARENPNKIHHRIVDATLFTIPGMVLFHTRISRDFISRYSKLMVYALGAVMFQMAIRTM